MAEFAQAVTFALSTNDNVSNRAAFQSSTTWHAAASPVCVSYFIQEPIQSIKAVQKQSSHVTTTYYFLTFAFEQLHPRAIQHMSEIDSDKKYAHKDEPKREVIPFHIRNSYLIRVQHTRVKQHKNFYFHIHHNHNISNSSGRSYIQYNSLHGGSCILGQFSHLLEEKFFCKQYREIKQKRKKIKR